MGSNDEVSEMRTHLASVSSPFRRAISAPDLVELLLVVA